MTCRWLTQPGAAACRAASVLVRAGVSSVTCSSSSPRMKSVRTSELHAHSGWLQACSRCNAVLIATWTPACQQAPIPALGLTHP